MNTVEKFITIGENLHATRVVKRNGNRTAISPNGNEAVVYKHESGELRYMEVPYSFKKTQSYEQGNIKHFMIAAWGGVGDDRQKAHDSAEYVRWEARRQTRAGARFLDLNVDEASYKLPEQKDYMRWMVRAVQAEPTIPLSIDSSNPEIIEAGLEVYSNDSGRPMLNSVAMERLDTLDLAVRFDAAIVASAAAVDGMPETAEDRLENAGIVVEAAMNKNIAAENIYIDPLFFPISVSSSNGVEALKAISLLRKEFGDVIKITGGMSNISFGLPKRKLINQVFIKMAIEAGADSGIIDPVQCSIYSIASLDTAEDAFKITTNMLNGEDEFCLDYIAACRENKI